MSEDADPGPAPSSGAARGALAISLGQASLMVTGGVLALLITQFFGKGAGTDAFFTAYGFYVIAVSFAQTLRLTALPRLMGDVRGDAESRLLAATALLAVIAAVPMLALAGPVGRLIANGDPSGVAADTLRLLWPALTLHLIAGVMVPMLTLREIYAPIGVAFGLASVISVVTFVLLEPELGLNSVPIGLTTSAALLAATLYLRLRITDWRLRAAPFLRLREAAAGAWALVVSSASFLVVNVAYLICLAVANHEQRGTATTYAYAFFVGAFLVACTAIPSAMVRAPGLLDKGGDRGVTTTDVIHDFRIALVPLVPAFGLAAVAAAPFAEWIAGEFFSAADARSLVLTLFALSPWVLASVAGILPVLELLNGDRARALAWVAFAHGAALVPLAIGGRLLLGGVGIALAQSAAMGGATYVQFRMAFEVDGTNLLRSIVAAALKAAIIVAVCFGPAYAVITADAMAAGIVLAIAGFAFCMWALKGWFRDEFQLLSSLLVRSPRPVHD